MAAKTGVIKSLSSGYFAGLMARPFARRMMPPRVADWLVMQSRPRDVKSSIHATIGSMQQPDFMAKRTATNQPLNLRGPRFC